MFGTWIFLHVFIVFKYNCIHVCKITKAWKPGTFLPHLTSFGVFQSNSLDKYSSSSILFQSQSVSNSYWVLTPKKAGGTGWHKGLNAATQVPHSAPSVSLLNIPLFSPWIPEEKQSYRRRLSNRITELCLNRDHSFLGQNLEFLSFNLDGNCF